MIDPLEYFWLLLKASLFSTGGQGNLPSLYDDMLARGWADESQFAELLAIGQLSPGPSGLWVICLGYLTYGLRGALLASLALCLPPLAVLLLLAIYRRIGDHPAVEGFMRGLSLAVAGIFCVVMLVLLRDTGIDWRSLGLLVAGAALGATRRVPVPVLLLLAAIAGITLY